MGVLDFAEPEEGMGNLDVRFLVGGHGLAGDRGSFRLGMFCPSC